ncbi:hypothetical protein B0H16DRAFT_154877 [Mycena metata]|uniref:Uncharacterized protein n=1 Tax=Mycena metata TaxID=1033252 RepID=A0AAD7MVU3_9AGAR|nr:hypothetical protein B0H16DRAFT_154877 [Mycena metata]
MQDVYASTLRSMREDSTPGSGCGQGSTGGGGGRASPTRLSSPPPWTSLILPAYPTPTVRRSGCSPAPTRPSTSPPSAHPQSARVVSVRIHSAHRVPRPAPLRYTHIGRGAPSVFPQRLLVPSLGCTRRNLTPRGGAEDVRLLVGFVLAVRVPPTAGFRPPSFLPCLPPPLVVLVASLTAVLPIAMVNFAQVSRRPHQRAARLRASAPAPPHPIDLPSASPTYQSALTARAPHFTAPYSSRVRCASTSTAYTPTSSASSTHPSTSAAHPPCRLVVSYSCSYTNRPSTATDEAEGNGIVDVERRLRVRVRPRSSTEGV